MKLLKPSWVNHADNSIFSIDVHPDGSRFATGGQGQDSGKIIIWNMGPVIDKAKEVDEKVPKFLCQMDHHIACVNVVRWSNNGLFLASGSDDKLIMIWQYVQGGMAYQNIENWKCGFTLRGHSGDVMDLAWSAKDQYLATCSVDNTVIIWNALKFPDIISRINAHAGLVKGVAWDPVGIYFASQSDDKTLKIWRTLDWSLEKSIDEPFKQCAGTTHVLRLNWSPDGQLIISAHAINNGAPTAQCIDRGNKWSTKLDFVGHRKAVTAVRFFPQILKPIEAKNSNTTEFKTHCLFALGSRDRSISIWLTNYSRPLCVVQDLFDNPIMDLSWSKSPKPGLLACSMDGTVSYIEFDYEEIGCPLSRPEVEDFFMKKYNHDINATVCLKPNNINQQMNQQQVAAKKDQSFKFIENLDILMAQEEKQKQQQQNNFITNENSNTQFHNSNSLTNTPSKHHITENQKQIERRMPDGRRRITPICICKPGEYDTPKPFGSEDNFNKEGFEKSIGFGSPNDVKIVSKTATEQSTIIVEKRDERNEIVEISPVKSVTYNKSVNLNNSNTNNSNSNDVTIIAKQTQSQPVPTNNDTQINPSQTIKSSTQPITKPFNSTTSKQNEILSTTNTEKEKPKELIKTISTVSNNNINTSLNMSQQQSQPKLNSTPNITSKPVSKQPQSNKQSNQSTSQSQQQPLNKQKQPINNSNNSTTNKTQLNSAQPMDISEPIKQQPQSMSRITTPSKNIDHGSPHHNQSLISQQLLIPLKIDKKFLTKIICDKTPNRSSISLEIHNSISLYDLPSANLTTTSSIESEYQLNLIKYLVDFKLKWQVYLTKKICEVASSSSLLACVCIDSTIHFYKSSNGIQLCCPIILDSRAAVLKCKTFYCMCVTVNGFVYVWKYEQNTDKQKEFHCLTTIINRQSCQSILRDGVFTNALLTDHGIPVIYMSKNRSYFYSLQTECWHLVPLIGNLIGQDSQLLFNSSSLFSDHSKSINLTSNDDIVGPLSIIQSKDKSTSLIKTIELIHKTSLNDNPLFNQNDFTLTHLESQINASIGLNSSKEYKFWLMTYARYLSENDYEDKLTDLCNFLLGPLYSSNWNDTILNFKKRDLLKEVLTIVAQNLKFQRLYSYYKQQMNSISQLSNPITKNNLLNRLKGAQLQTTPSMNIITTTTTTTALNSQLESTQILNEESSQVVTAKSQSQPTQLLTVSTQLLNSPKQDFVPVESSQYQEENKQEIIIESENNEQMDVMVAVIETSEESEKKNEIINETIQEITVTNGEINDKSSDTKHITTTTTVVENTTKPLPSTITEILMNIE